MMNLLKLTQAARGQLGFDEMLSMLSSIGVDLQVQSLEMKTAEGQDEFKALAGASLLSGSKVVKLSATLTDGDHLHAILVIPPK